ncbi:unnamed protein product [Microthlaspi erraticum]|uniref:Uncharacterized protein n=1 Tax=Microthlaspi erraticum TaxID=1685480 RepID=A0A6D2HUU4_9BRAS|nr:unnamed protein product [Microthlaspi erraticum]
MDFIKTSSLRALIELTFQRNWNGFIWMSRKGVIAKRVKAAPDGHIENQRPNAQSGWPRNECSALGQNRISVRLKSRPKSKPLGRSHITTRETLSRGRPSQRFTPLRARPTRASRGTSLAAAQLTSRTTADASVRAGKNVPRPAEKPSAKFIRPTSRPTVKSSGPDRSDSAKDPTVRPTVPTTVRTPRSTRSRF